MKISAISSAYIHFQRLPELQYFRDSCKSGPSDVKFGEDRFAVSLCLIDIPEADYV